MLALEEPIPVRLLGVCPYLARFFCPVLPVCADDVVGLGIIGCFSLPFVHRMGTVATSRDPLGNQLRRSRMRNQDLEGLGV